MFGHVAVVLATVLLLTEALFTKKLDIRKGAIVHLHEWKWDDIARECEEFLAPKGFAAVMTSPPHENLVVPGHPWNERLQVVSYKLISRSGNEEQLKSMLQRCNKVGVRVFAHAVINQMTGNVDDCKGVGGSTCNAKELSYPAVPYTKEDFHPPCQISYESDAKELKECELFGFHDLNQTRPNVRDHIVDYLNHLIDIGFAGFNIDAAMHMYPADIRNITRRLNNLNVNLGLPNNTKPFIYQEVIDLGRERDREREIINSLYTPMGLVTDGRYTDRISDIFSWEEPLHLLRHFGENMAPEHSGIVFVDDYVNERFDHQLNYKNPTPYKMALAFMMAWGHGTPLILSSYKFEKPEDGPPADEKDKESLLSPNPDKDNKCKEQWVCQHRWRQVYSMVAFNKATYEESVSMWWDNGQQQMAFARGNKGFAAFNMEDEPLEMTLKTNLPPGKYCDVISGSVENGKCKGTTIEVNNKGYAEIHLPAYDEDNHDLDGVLAIFDHESSRLGGSSSSGAEKKPGESSSSGEEKKPKKQ